jgi:F-type H+-transporting ATPase subunit gamma
MKVICLASLLAVANAFTTQRNAFTTTPSVVERASNNVMAEPIAHRNRRATIVMDGKANGESY